MNKSIKYILLLVFLMPWQKSYGAWAFSLSQLRNLVESIPRKLSIAKEASKRMEAHAAKNFPQPETLDQIRSLKNFDDWYNWSILTLRRMDLPIPIETPVDVMTPQVSAYIKDFITTFSDRPNPMTAPHDPLVLLEFKSWMEKASAMTVRTAWGWALEARCADTDEEKESAKPYKDEYYRDRDFAMELADSAKASFSKAWDAAIQCGDGDDNARYKCLVSPVTSMYKAMQDAIKAGSYYPGQQDGCLASLREICGLPRW